MVSHGTYEADRQLLDIERGVLCIGRYVVGEEVAEVADNEVVQQGIVAVLLNEERRGGQESVGHGFAIYLINNIGLRETRLRQIGIAEVGFAKERQLVKVLCSLYVTWFYAFFQGLTSSFFALNVPCPME